MDGTNTTPKSNRLLMAVIVLFCLVVLLQLGILLQRHLNKPMTAASSPTSGTVWSPSDEIESMHARINRMFDQAFHPPLPISQPPAITSPPPATPDGSAVSSFEDPFLHMRRMQRQIDAMFAATLNDMDRRQPGFDEGWTRLEITPGFSIQDSDTAYEVTVNLPGVDKSNIHISMENSILGLIIEQSLQNSTVTSTGVTVRQSAQTSRFERHLRLPGATDKQSDIKAIYRDGILRITVPKIQKTVSTPQSIDIR